MLFFHRDELIVRCAYRGLALSVPDYDRLLNACAPEERRRLQRLLGRPSDEAGWLLQWRKDAGDVLQPNDVVATLSRDGVVVELAYAQGGTLAERLVGPEQPVATGKRLALQERRAKQQPPPSVALIRQYVARQRQDAKTIATLEAELAALQARLTAGQGTVTDAKFKRLKHEFSRRYHPDTRLPGDEERLRRERVFQEFWPIVEEIERS